MKELIEIQNELKVLKDKTKEGIKFMYRTCEQILQEVKPLCKTHGVLLTVSDEAVLVGERYYIKATATVTKDKELVSTSGYAREPEKLMSMSYPQITGSCSSYARKIALGGLFAIDDNQDPDGDDGSHTEKETEKKAPQRKLMTPIQKATLKDLIVKLEKIGSESSNRAVTAIDFALGSENPSFDDISHLINRINLTIKKAGNNVN